MITTQDVTLFCQKEFLKMITPTSSKYKHMHAVVCYCSPLALTVVSELTAEICVLQTVNKNIDWETRKLRGFMRAEMRDFTRSRTENLDRSASSRGQLVFVAESV